MEKKLPSLKLPQGKELKAHVFLTLGVIFLVYMIVSTGQALWQNYQLDKELSKLREEHNRLQLHNRYLQNLIAYRKTDAFRDKQAREKLNYQKQGETVLIIPNDDISQFSEGNTNKQPENDDTFREPTNAEKWWHFIFG